MAVTRNGRYSLSQLIDKFSQLTTEPEWDTNKLGELVDKIGSTYEDPSGKMILATSFSINHDNSTVSVALCEEGIASIRPGQSWSVAVISDTNHWLTIGDAKVAHIIHAGAPTRVIFSYSKIIGDTWAKPFPSLTMWVAHE